MPTHCLGTLKIVAGSAGWFLSQGSVFSGRSQRKIDRAGSNSPREEKTVPSTSPVQGLLYCYIGTDCLPLVTNVIKIRKTDTNIRGGT